MPTDYVLGAWNDPQDGDLHPGGTSEIWVSSSGREDDGQGNSYNRGEWNDPQDGALHPDDSSDKIWVEAGSYWT